MAHRLDNPAFLSALDEETLTAELHALGIRPGTVLLTHSSLRGLGPVRGGSRTVVRALRAALGPDGTLVVPTFTPENSDTSPVYRQRVQGLTAAQVAELRRRMPPFDPAYTPARSTGRLAEEVRTHPEALRSSHPQTSFAAIGPLARRIVSGHAPRCHLGEDSPMAKLYDVGAQVLLLGVGFASCTAFHLAEYRVPEKPVREYHCVIRDRGARTWWSFTDVALDDSDFVDVGASFERSGAAVRAATVGRATARLFAFRAAVDHAVGWLTAHRPGPRRG
ncbi:aminoglycoside N(3)-acetyltransferase [Streptomyces sp. NPDC049627]|uniref:aminoglycoside N(3)-acetyltransferase n=1 Tax=Streptomyces sp. NPDC049627 TaxID=3365595 RepID=UPI0037BDB5B6